MVKLKYDVKDSDPESAKAAGSFEKPKPGMYRFSIKEVNLGLSKGDDGKPDKTKPRVEVIFSCEDSRYKGAQVWAYFVQPGHEKWNKGAAEKWDQLLLALGISTKKRQGDIDTDKQMVGKFVTVRVRGGKDQSGEYKAEFGSVFEDGHDGISTEGPADEELLADDGGDDELLADDSDDGAVELDDDWDARKAELLGADTAALKDIAKAYSIKISGKKKAELVDEMIEYEKALADSPEDEEIIEDDELIEEEGHTKESLAAMETAELVANAKSLGIVTKGKKKSEVIEAILIAQGTQKLPF